MNNSDLKRFFTSGYKFTENDLKIIEDSVNKYPWFQLGHSLITKAKYTLHKDDYLKSLHTAAIHSPDREILFDFIYKKPQKPEATKTESQKPAKTAETPAKESTGIKKSIKEATETKIAPAVKADGTEIKSKDELREIVREQLRRIESERKKKTPPEKETPVTQTTKEKTPAKTKAKDKKEILDEFIKKEPSVSKPKDGPYDETLRLAKESLEDHMDFVSETLAEIYYKQDNPEKAIKIYEQLILKLPEKKLYFAARIKEIVDNK